MWKGFNVVGADSISIAGFKRTLVLVLCIHLVMASATLAGESPKGLINCDIQQGPCQQVIGSRTVTLDILPRPVEAMQDLTFTVSMDGDPVSQAPYIKLNMPAMDMGKNRVNLELKKPGVYQGKGVIVRCRSGRRTWKATVALPDIGAVDFIFDVIY